MSHYASLVCRFQEVAREPVAPPACQTTERMSASQAERWAETIEATAAERGVQGLEPLTWEALVLQAGLSGPAAEQVVAVLRGLA